jgi:predicted lipoprotein with Yx(FWY)xxD motif
MRRISKVLIPLAVSAVLVAGCGGEDDETAAPAAATTSLVSVGTVDGTDVLVDREGRTLYTAAVEDDGNILCVDACVSFWEPTEASADDAERSAADLDADLGVVERPTGESQLTFEGLPLYTFAEEDAGQLEGDGFVDDFQGTRFEWEAARPAGGSGAPADGPSGGYGY